MKPQSSPVPPALAALQRAVRERTPARILVGRTGAAYPTATQLTLRQDHAAALDSVRAELDVARDFSAEFVERWSIFEVRTNARDKEAYLLRPDLGRQLSPAARETIAQRCPARVDLQVAIGDGLSVAAVISQVPPLLEAIEQETRNRNWSFGQPFVIRYCRVGVLNDIGELLGADVTVLLIGERPGLVSANSLSAYMAYQPRQGHTDADRNLISNIHAEGVSPAVAAVRILRLAEQMKQQETSGVGVKEQLANRISVEKRLGADR